MSQRNQNIFLIALLALAALVYYLDATAQVHYYYWEFWWYDIMMHFLGGLTVSGVGLWFFTRFVPFSQTQLNHILYIAIGTVLVIGISWEFFEYFNGMYVGQPHIVVDTVGDLVMDIIGSLVAGLSIREILKRSLRIA